jgi:hypothetical protein
VPQLHRTTHRSKRAHKLPLPPKSVRESAVHEFKEREKELVVIRQIHVISVFMPDKPSPPSLTASAKIALPPVGLATPVDQSLADRIARLAAQWRRETGHLSSIERKVIHPAYQSILATGKRGLPYVLRELKERSGHWFWALHFMSGGVDFGDVRGIEELRNKWLAWGIKEGYAGLQ